MNLAQCIAPEFAQTLPARGATVHPAEMPWSRTTTRENGISTVRMLVRPSAAPTELVQYRIERDSDWEVGLGVMRAPAPVRLPVARIPVSQARVPIPVARMPAEAPVLLGRSLYEARRRSESNPWPRGKSGLRFRILTAIRGGRAPGLHLSDLAARLAGWSCAQLSMELRNMVLDRWLSRSGVSRHFKYTLTPAGNAALDWQG